ncbi:hypothetical protein GCM10023159_31900 [Brevibacterium yomogidense]
MKAAWAAPAIVMVSGAPALACSPDSNPPLTYTEKAAKAHTTDGGPIRRVVTAPEWATLMTFKVIGGGGGVLSNRNGKSGQGAVIDGFIPISGGEKVTLRPGSAGQHRASVKKNTTNAAGVVNSTGLEFGGSGGHGMGSGSGGGGAASILQFGDDVLVVAGGGGGLSQSTAQSLGDGTFYYQGSSTLHAAFGKVPQGSGAAGVPKAAGSIAAGARGEGAYMFVTPEGARSPHKLTEGAIAMGVEGGSGGGTSAGGAGAHADSSWVWQKIKFNGLVNGHPGGRGHGGSADYQHADGPNPPSAGGGGGGYYGGGAGAMLYGTGPKQAAFQTGVGSGGGGGASWVSSVVDTFTGGLASNTASGGFGAHGLIEVTFSC